MKKSRSILKQMNDVITTLDYWMSQWNNGLWMNEWNNGLVDEWMEQWTSE